MTRPCVTVTAMDSGGGGDDLDGDDDNEEKKAAEEVGLSEEDILRILPPREGDIGYKSRAQRI